MSLEDLQYEELIQYCKDNDLDYLTKAKKPKAHATLLKELSKLSITDKTDIQTNNLELIIKQCHNYLYKSAGIVGSKAQNDIMRILIIRIFNILLSNKNKYIEKILNDYKETNSIFKDFKNTYNEDINNITNEEEKEIIQKHLNYIDYLYNVNNILEYKGNAIEDEWKEFIIYCVSDILKNIYSKDDYRFNTPNSYDINELIKIISKISINDDFISNFAEHNGDIHEYFLKYQGNTNSKELGQYFTPRVIIEKTLNECGLKDMILNLDNSKLDICDPCMGTGGLLCYTYKYCKDKILPSNIYGCDIEKDTIKFGVASLMLTTNEYNENIIRCNSLIENPYLFENKKFDIVFTNPPFGTKNNYKDLKNNFESYKKLNYKDSSLKFEDIYLINTNKGTYLFIQLIVYLLKENGICAIVLPDGELMTSNNNSNIEIRKFILDKCKILKIINVEGGAFTNTGIKTKVLIFQKGNYDNYNQEIEFLEINSNGVNSLGLEKLNSTFQFNISKKEEITNYNKDIEVKTLGEVCDIDKNVLKHSTEYGKPIGKYKFHTGGIKTDLYVDKYDIEDMYIIQNRTNGSGKCNLFLDKNFSLAKQTMVYKSNNNNDITTKYIYYYLLNNINILEDGFIGANHKNISHEYLENIKIPIPLLEQQKEIVEYLDIINKNTKSSNDKIEEIKKLNEEYLKINVKYNKNIEIKTLGDVFKLNGNGKTNSKDITNTGEYPFYKASNLNPSGTNNKYDFNGDNYLLIIKSGGCANNPINTNYGIGKVFLVNGKCAANIAVFQLLPITNNNIKYLYYYLLHIQTKIQSLAIYCTNNGNINMNELMNIEIPIPSLEKQKEIVEYLDFNNNLIDNLNKEIENNKKQGESFFNMFLSD
jgi:type I restriction enzyme S subunit